MSYPNESFAVTTRISANQGGTTNVWFVMRLRKLVPSCTHSIDERKQTSRTPTFQGRVLWDRVLSKSQIPSEATSSSCTKDDFFWTTCFQLRLLFLWLSLLLLLVWLRTRHLFYGSCVSTVRPVVIDTFDWQNTTIWQKQIHPKNKTKTTKNVRKSSSVRHTLSFVLYNHCHGSHSNRFHELSSSLYCEED